MWLDFEPQLIARLKAKLDPAIAVIAARDLSGIKESLQITPAVQVYGGEYVPIDVATAGNSAVVEQHWTCVVVVRNSVDQKTGAAARSDADPICDAVLAALMGWPLADPASLRLRLARAPAPMWSVGGFGYYPIAFTRRVTFAGDPT